MEARSLYEGMSALPDIFAKWFASRGWHPRAHQLALLERAREGRAALLIAPTGGGKTLAGFLPSLIDIAVCGAHKNLHTLYISPLKALAVDVARNLTAPIEEMGLEVTVEVRTGDTPQARRRRQLQHPPDILITTPEQIALLIAMPDAAKVFAGLKRIIIDELHAFAPSKRGALLSLGLARLAALAPQARAIGLSATVAEPDDLRAFLTPQAPQAGPRQMADIVHGVPGAEPDIAILDSLERVPWSGHSAAYAMAELYRRIARARLALVFVNTRSQAERLFQGLWELNEDGLAIALHHGSLDVGQRRKVEAAMARGTLRAVVCTSTLDLGIDWGDVDLVVNVGAPKGASRLAQRIGRANHRQDEPSRALLVPANRFEVLECRAALEAAKRGDQDAHAGSGMPLDVLAQHVLGVACAGPVSADDLYAEVTTADIYRRLDRVTFDRVVDFVATGGYALRAYDRYARLKPTRDGRLRIAHPNIARQYRLNIGTIVEAPMLKIRLVNPRRRGRALAGGKMLGEAEEWFIEQLVPGDTFLFAGQVLRFEALRDMDAFVSRARTGEPRVPSYQGGKFPLSTYLSKHVRAILADPERWNDLPPQVRDWLKVQSVKSRLPGREDLLVECFPRARKHYLVCYPFEGRLAHQSLGMLLTRRLERAGARPLGFVANDYALSVWGLRDMGHMAATGALPLDKLFDKDMLGDDLDAWLRESSLMKRTFRTCAIIAGLIERRHPGREKSGRQVTVSSDLIYDVLRAHEPDHILLTAAWQDAATGLLDIHRLGDMLARVEGRIALRRLDAVSPLAVPSLLEIGREPVYGEAQDALLEEAADKLIEEAMRLV